MKIARLFTLLFNQGLQQDKIMMIRAGGFLNSTLLLNKIKEKQLMNQVRETFNMTRRTMYKMHGKSHNTCQRSKARSEIRSSSVHSSASR